MWKLRNKMGLLQFWLCKLLLVKKKKNLDYYPIDFTVNVICGNCEIKWAYYSFDYVNFACKKEKKIVPSDLSPPLTILK